MSRNLNRQTMVLCATLAFALGWFTPKAFDSWRSTEQREPQQAGGTAPYAAPTASGAALDALSRFKAIEWSAQPLTGADELVPALASSPSLHAAALERVVPRLHALTQHPLSNIGQASIQRIAQWDKAQLHVTQDVLRLLSDPDVEVRLAAIGATSIASLRSRVALNLGRFALNANEYATYQAVQTGRCSASCLAIPMAGKQLTPKPPRTAEGCVLGNQTPMNSLSSRLETILTQAHQERYRPGTPAQSTSESKIGLLRQFDSVWVESTLDRLATAKIERSAL